MSNQQAGSDEALLTIKDRINYSYIVSKQLLTIQQAILMQDEDEIREAIDGLVSLIPTYLKDPDFKKDIKNAKVIRKEPDYFCGVPLEGTEKKVVIFDYNVKLQACTDLLFRRGMLSKTRWKEIATGKKFNAETLSEEDFLGDMSP